MIPVTFDLDLTFFQASWGKESLAMLLDFSVVLCTFKTCLFITFVSPRQLMGTSTRMPQASVKNTRLAKSSEMATLLWSKTVWRGKWNPFDQTGNVGRNLQWTHSSVPPPRVQLIEVCVTLWSLPSQAVWVLMTGIVQTEICHGLNPGVISLH